MISPNILLDFELRSGWDRGIAQGIIEAGRVRNLNMILRPRGVGVEEMARTWDVSVIISGDPVMPWSTELASCFQIAVGHDRTSLGIPSVTTADAEIAALAAEHLLRTGIHKTAVFAYDDSEFAQARAASFREAIAAAGAECFEAGEFSNKPDAPNFCSHAAICAWLKQIPKPCGIFALCDDWAGPVATYCRHLGLRIPEDVLLVGVDNDPLVCELSSPPLTSIAIPWREIGQKVVRIVDRHLLGRSLAVQCIRVQPTGVVARRSSDVLSVPDELVAAAVAWIRRNAHKPIAVDDVLRAVPTYRQRLERQFRASLGRTVMEEVRRAHVELAKTLLMSTQLRMSDIASRSGFASSTILGVNFRKELGLTPSDFRRRSRGDSNYTQAL